MSLSTRSQLASTNPYFAWAIEYILTVADQYRGQYTITSVNRTADKQWELFRQFDSKAVAPGCSQHQYGAAVDVVFSNEAWQNWYLASARNFGLSTVVGDPVHVQLIPGGRFREWTVSQGLCPDPSFPVNEFTSSRQWRDCLLNASRTKGFQGSCDLPCGQVYGIPC